MSNYCFAVAFTVVLVTRAHARECTQPKGRTNVCHYPENELRKLYVHENASSLPTPPPPSFLPTPASTLPLSLLECFPERQQRESARRGMRVSLSPQMQRGMPSSPSSLQNEEWESEREFGTSNGRENVNRAEAERVLSRAFRRKWNTGKCQQHKVSVFRERRHEKRNRRRRWEEFFCRELGKCSPLPPSFLLLLLLLPSPPLSLRKRKFSSLYLGSSTFRALSLPSFTRTRKAVKCISHQRGPHCHCHPGTKCIKQAREVLQRLFRRGKRCSLQEKGKQRQDWEAPKQAGRLAPPPSSSHSPLNEREEEATMHVQRNWNDSLLLLPWDEKQFPSPKRKCLSSPSDGINRVSSYSSITERASQRRGRNVPLWVSQWNCT